jgi:hypothetical protein
MIFKSSYDIRNSVATVLKDYTINFTCEQDSYYVIFGKGL